MRLSVPGRVLFLCADPAHIEAQLAGELVSFAQLKQRGEARATASP